MDYDNSETASRASSDFLDITQKIAVARRELEYTRARNRELIAVMKSVCVSLGRLAEVEAADPGHPDKSR